ncbi:MAG TPA: hypothetical protein VEB64_04105, partial [Azospirillaceae bacterium]|nr:hypothetical protein [Azospirillaceae bacterium]
MLSRADFYRTTFQAALTTGKAAEATYTPPVGPPVSSCIAMSMENPLEYGPGKMTLPVDGHVWDVLRDDFAAPPQLGGTLTIGEVTYPIDSPPLPLPVRMEGNEPTRWRLLSGWGTAITYRATEGTGSALNPPNITGAVTVSANAAAGAGAVSIKATYATGQLRAGDKIVIGANTYAVAGTVSVGTANTFANVPVSPALAESVTAGQAVTLQFARDFSVRAAVTGYRAEELQGGLQVGDRRLIVPHAAFVVAGWA